MAGPIRDLLARQPVRNAVRTLLGMPTRYGNMGTALDSVSATDRMQGADLMARPTRLMRRRGILNPQAEVGTTAMTVAPSPEAKAVANAREQDSQRRMQRQRASEMSPAANQPQDPATPVTPVASATPQPEPAAPSTSPNPSPADPRLARMGELQARAQAYRGQAASYEAMQGYRSNPVLQGLAQQKLLLAASDEQRADEMMTQIAQENFALAGAESAQRQSLERLKVTNPPDTLASNAADLATTVREQGILVATRLMADTWAKSNGTTDPALIRNQELLYGMANSGTALAQRLASRQAPVEGDPMIAEMAQIVSQLGADAKSRASVVTRIVGAAQQQSPGLSGQQAAALSRHLSAMIEKQLNIPKQSTWDRYWSIGSGGN